VTAAASNIASVFPNIREFNERWLQGTVLPVMSVIQWCWANDPAAVRLIMQKRTTVERRCVLLYVYIAPRGLIETRSRFRRTIQVAYIIEFTLYAIMCNLDIRKQSNIPTSNTYGCVICEYEFFFFSLLIIYSNRSRAFPRDEYYFITTASFDRCRNNISAFRIQ